MNDIFKWIGKFLLQFVLWIFILSINLNGKTLFKHGNEFLVQNALVQSLDEELADLWSRVSETARLTFGNATPKETTL